MKNNYMYTDTQKIIRIKGLFADDVQKCRLEKKTNRGMSALLI